MAERKDVLSTFFGLLTLGAYGWYCRRPRLPRYLVVTGFFALSLLAKPMLVTLPALLLLLDFWPLGRWVLTGPGLAGIPRPNRFLPHALLSLFVFWPWRNCLC